MLCMLMDEQSIRRMIIVDSLRRFAEWYYSSKYVNVSNIEVTYNCKRNHHNVTIDFIDIKWYLVVPYNIDFISFLNLLENKDVFFEKLLVFINKRLYEVYDE